MCAAERIAAECRAEIAYHSTAIGNSRPIMRRYHREMRARAYVTLRQIRGIEIFEWSA